MTDSYNVGWKVHAVIFILHSKGPLYEAANNPSWSITSNVAVNILPPIPKIARSVTGSDEVCALH